MGSWGAVSTALSTLSGSLCLPFTPRPAAPASPFGLPLFLFHYAFGKAVFLSCHVSGEILLGDEVLSCVFGLWPRSNSPLTSPM